MPLILLVNELFQSAPQLEEKLMKFKLDENVPFSLKRIIENFGPHQGDVLSRYLIVKKRGDCCYYLSTAF